MSKTQVLWGFRPGSGDTGPFPLADGTAAKCRAELNRRAKAGWICEIAPARNDATAPAAITERHAGLTSGHDDDLGFTVTRYGDLGDYPRHRDEAGFAWTCRTPRLKGGDGYDRAQVAEVCDITSGDRDWYEQHQARHGRTALGLPKMPGPWKPPPPKAYEPKPLDPGQPVKWTHHVPGHWERPDGTPATDPVTGGITGQWVEGVTRIRTGTIWSAGPASASTSWWAVPDDDPAEPVVIRRHGKGFDFKLSEGDLYQADGWGAGWRDGIRRAENVRKRGIYPVVQDVIKSGYSSWSGGRRPDEKIIRWHADPDCPVAAGGVRDDGQGFAYDRDWDINQVVDVLVGRRQVGGQPPFCGQCIMLDAPARTPACAGNEALARS